MVQNLSTLRIGTRSSKLARWQAELVARRLREAGVESVLEFIRTTGDLDRTRDFGSLGAKGVFVKEIEAALLEKKIDIAVHSLKDLPTQLPEGLVLGAVLERADPRDALVSANGCMLTDLPRGARLATGSLRRAAQALALRPDLHVVPLRGNVPTRVDKIMAAEADATLLAVAGLTRLGLEARIAETFSAERVTPAMGQGAIAIESRAGEHEELLGGLDHPASRLAAEAERLFVKTIGGGCRTPVGVLAEPADSDAWRLTAVISSPDGASLLRRVREAPSGDALRSCAAELARAMYEEADDSIRATLDRPRHRGSEARGEAHG